MAQRHSILISSSLLVIALLSACTSIPARTVEADNPIKTVAVLPFINNSNNVEGPAKMQFHFTAGLYERYYDVVEPDEVNQKLKDQMGVTLGAQLDMAKPDLLCKTFNVDGLLYGSLDDYISKPFGVYTIKRVRARAKLVDCKTGQTVWKGGAGGKSQVSTGGNVGALVGAVGSIGSAISDVSEGDLPPLLGEQVEAPWFNVPPPPKQSSGNIIADVVIGIVETVAQHAAGVSLSREEYGTVTTALDGYFHEPSISGKTEKGIPSGPTDED